LKSHTGARLDVDDYTIRARWTADRSLQEFVLEGDHSGTIRSGDTVYLKNFFGNYIDVNGTRVEAQWHDRGKWQRLQIERAVFGPVSNDAVSNGDVVYFRSHTGMYIDVVGHEVRARWPDQGEWQAFWIHDLDEEQNTGDIFHGALDIIGAGCGFPKAVPNIKCHTFMETDCTSTESLAKACPDGCPYVAPHPQLSCVFECTKAEDCSSANPENAFANNLTHMCEQCDVVGCRRCSSRHICEECFDNFLLGLGSRACIYVWDDRAQHGVHAAAALILGLALLTSICLVIADHCACCGRCLPHESPDEELPIEELFVDEIHGIPSLEETPATKAIRLGKLHRSKCRIRNLVDSDSQSPITRTYSDQGPLQFANLPLWTNLRAQFLTGVGLPLFHQWYAFLFLYSVLMTAGTFWVYRYSELGGVLQKTGMDSASEVLYGADAMGLCGLRARNHDQLGDSVRAFARRAALVYFVLWVLGFCLSIAHAARQKRIAAEFYKDHPCLAEFTINVEGFPPDATDEVKIRNFLREAFCTEALEVSVCYDYRMRRHRVHELLEKCLVHEDVRAGTYESSLTGGKDRRGGLGLSEQEREEVRSWLDPGNPEKLRNAGQVFAIFPHNYDLQRCRERFEAELGTTRGGFSMPTPPTLPHQATPRWLAPGTRSPQWVASDGKMHELTLLDVVCEPPDVVWENLGTELPRLIMGHIAAALMIIGSFAAMAAALFVPLATYTINYMTQAGALPTGVMMTVLGTLVMAANWVMCFVHSKASSFVGHVRRDREGLLLFKVFAALCLVNFMFNVSIALFPESQAHAWEHMLRPLGSGLVTMQGVAFEARLSSHLFHVLVPGSLFIGYLIWPLQGFLWPFVSGLATLRCKYRRTRAVSAREAELHLEPLGISLPHDYMGTIVQPTACSLVLFFSSDVAWQTFACLVGWSVFMVVFMRYLHLREVRRCYFTTNRLDTEVLFMWGLPLSMVLAASFFWMARLRDWSLYVVPIAWASGIALYGFVLANCVRPLIPPKSEGHACHRPGYDEVRGQRHYDWHNCNPIKVLLSHCYHDARDEAIAPFQTGKEYLQVVGKLRRTATTMGMRETWTAAKRRASPGGFGKDFLPEIEMLINGPLEAIHAVHARVRRSQSKQEKSPKASPAKPPAEDIFLLSMAAVPLVASTSQVTEPLVDATSPAYSVDDGAYSPVASSPSPSASGVRTPSSATPGPSVPLLSLPLPVPLPLSVRGDFDDDPDPVPDRSSLFDTDVDGGDWPEEAAGLHAISMTGKGFGGFDPL